MAGAKDTLPEVTETAEAFLKRIEAESSINVAPTTYPVQPTISAIAKAIAATKPIGAKTYYEIYVVFPPKGKVLPYNRYYKLTTKDIVTVNTLNRQGVMSQQQKQQTEKDATASGKIGNNAYHVGSAKNSYDNIVEQIRGVGVG